jgi:hypothetical protein
MGESPIVLANDPLRPKDLKRDLVALSNGMQGPLTIVVRMLLQVNDRLNSRRNINLDNSHSAGRDETNRFLLEVA